MRDFDLGALKFIHKLSTVNVVAKLGLSSGQKALQPSSRLSFLATLLAESFVSLLLPQIASGVDKSTSESRLQVSNPK